ncbi:MAG: methyltransferase domain-containing protein [Balneolales bacterium]
MTFRQNSSTDLRYKRTLKFLKSSLPQSSALLDLGPPNPFSRIMTEEGYRVQNTAIDLDESPEALQEAGCDAVTAFEILEHLLNPLGVLQHLNAPKLFATVPLDLWFSSAYYNRDDLRDRHFHEFEDWQFDWLLDKGGWKIIRREKWNNPSYKIGVRPLLRWITPRYYAVEAIRK